MVDDYAPWVKRGLLPLTSYSLGKHQFKHTTIIVRKVNNKNAETEGIDSFDTPEALAINRARLEHLESLNLDINGKSVLDVGCGVGHLAQFFLQKECNVLAVDGRSENIASLQSRYPELKSAVVDVERDKLTEYGMFDIVFCYGLLYHLENPTFALQNMASVCKELLLIETCITDCPQPVLQLVDESATYNQALSGTGSRPSPSYVVMSLLNAGFPYVYVPDTIPDHADFKFLSLFFSYGGDVHRNQLGVYSHYRRHCDVNVNVGGPGFNCFCKHFLNINHFMSLSISLTISKSV